MTKDEIQAIIAEEQRMDAVANGVTEAARQCLMDMGYYNDSLRGYLIEAMKAVGFGRDEICKALSGLHTVLDDTSAAEAAQAYREF